MIFGMDLNYVGGELSRDQEMKIGGKCEFTSFSLPFCFQVIN
jgi:hypothetical protein